MLKYLHALFLCSALSFVSVVDAAYEEEQAKLQSTIDTALDVVYSDCCHDLGDEAKQLKVREALEANYDLNVIIRRAIGRNWRKLSSEEQTTVVELVKQLVLKAYVKGLEGASRPEVHLEDVVVITEKRIEIPSIVRMEGKSYHVLYRLGRMPSGWQIYDIVAENISVVSNYRQQMDDHFRKGNGADLISKLEELLTKEDINEDIQL